MTENQKKILKKYIKKVLLESEGVEIQQTDSLTAILQKGYNRPYPIGEKEFEKIKEAIKYRQTGVKSVDITNNTIKFEIGGTPTNFHFVIRKVVNPTNSGQFRYVIWYVPFTQREDIDKPGAVTSIEGDPFDKNINIPNFLSNIYEFFLDALLINK